MGQSETKQRYGVQRRWRVNLAQQFRGFEVGVMPQSCPALRQAWSLHTSAHLSQIEWYASGILFLKVSSKASLMLKVCLPSDKEIHKLSVESESTHVKKSQEISGNKDRALMSHATFPCVPTCNLTCAVLKTMRSVISNWSVFLAKGLLVTWLVKLVDNQRHEDSHTGYQDSRVSLIYQLTATFFLIA